MSNSGRGGWRTAGGGKGNVSKNLGRTEPSRNAYATASSTFFTGNDRRVRGRERVEGTGAQGG